MFELLKIPYVGCGIFASSVGMDKTYTKIIFEKAKINQAKHIYIKDIEGDNVTLVEANLEEKKISLEEVVNLANDNPYAQKIFYSTKLFDEIYNKVREYFHLGGETKKTAD